MLLACIALAEDSDASETEGASLNAADAVPAEDDDAQGVESSDADEAPKPARGYVLVSTATQMGFLPLPDEGEYSYSLKQTLSDGSEAENVIHVTADGVYMEDSTCENHDCVAQGEVTLDNRKDRILGSMIICLPNQVYLQLCTPDEIEEMVRESAAEQEQAEEEPSDANSAK